MQLSYTSGCASEPLLGETIASNLERVALSAPGNEALVDVARDRRWTYGELDIEVTRLAKALMASGVEKGDRVGIWAPNCPEWVLLQYATARIGAILVCINPAYRASELAFVLRHAGVAVLMAARENRGSDYRALVESIRGQAPALRRVVYIGDACWEELVASAHRVTDAQLRTRERALSFDDPINIQYTSGTTGSPKGATLTHHNILNNGYFVGEVLGYTQADRICLPVPFYHCFGMVMGNLGATSHGAAIIIPSANFDAVDTLEAVAQERCTSLYGVPTMFIAELASEACDRLDLSSLRTGIMAGSPCPASVMREVMERMHMKDVAICYGMTETSPVSLMTRVKDDVRRRTQTVGRVMPHLEVQVVDPETGLVVPRDSVGEILTRGYSVMRGYWGQDEETRAAIDATGWMHTGDLGVMDSDGYVAIVGRSKDMVIRAGENIYPREIEEFLYSHPDIEDVQVIGVPDDRYGEELMACVRMRAGVSPLTAPALLEYCRGQLAHYKIPRYVRVMDEFPMTVTGKVRKGELRGQASRWLEANRSDRTHSRAGGDCSGNGDALQSSS